MSQTLFTQLDLSPEIARAIEEMGFETATEIQADSIPVIREGKDVIGRSQTGTGKTIAFGIPAIESIDTENGQNHAQVLILCPTRELAVQACEEIKKLARFKPGIHPADIYGGAPMDRQITKLKTANIVIGTPGRVMDHMRRKTLKLSHLKMVVLDEADEMLSMGFREDIETILSETPEDRQTILFSATMPPEILALTRKFQKNPELIEVDKKHVTVENIAQCYYNVPMGRKMDALNLILRYHDPKRAMIFCNTKKMVEEIAEYLHRYNFDVEGLHGDMKQSQRTNVMEAFKHGRISILVATDVAARGIDVNDIDYVINYDIPQNTEYYVHRIGRTGRAGKSGKAITICSGRRQADILVRIGRLVKSTITEEAVPSSADIKSRLYTANMAGIEEAVKSAAELPYAAMVEELVGRGYDPAVIAAVVMEMHFGSQSCEIADIKGISHSSAGERDGQYQKISINVGRANRVAPNHIVGAITERTDLCGKDIGKIEIFDDRTLVSVPKNGISTTISQMKNCKICGTPVVTTLYHSNGYKKSDSFGDVNARDHRNFKKRYATERYPRRKNNA